MSFAETLALEGIAASIGSIGDASDNALAESTIGLSKNEAIRDGSPFRTEPLRQLDDVDWITAAWVSWYNGQRLHTRLDDVPPDEFEQAHYATHERSPEPGPEPRNEAAQDRDRFILSGCLGLVLAVGRLPWRLGRLQAAERQARPIA